jgi:hypothetical protein
MADDGGVLGNLPRSRPGQRSDKRTEKTAARAAAKAERTGARAAEPTAAAETSAPPKSKTSLPPRPASGGRDPVGDAIRTVTGVAATGARVAGGVAREVLRRLPRP